MHNENSSRNLLFIWQSWHNDFFIFDVGKAAKPHTSMQNSSTQNSKDKSVNPVHQPSVFSDSGLFVEEILNKTSALLLSEVSSVQYASILTVVESLS